MGKDISSYILAGLDKNLFAVFNTDKQAFLPKHDSFACKHAYLKSS